MSSKLPKLPANLRGKFVSRAAFAKMQGEKQRLEKDIYTMVMSGTFAAIQVRQKWKKKFESDKELWNMLRDIARS